MSYLAELIPAPTSNIARAHNDAGMILAGRDFQNDIWCDLGDHDDDRISGA